MLISRSVAMNSCLIRQRRNNCEDRESRLMLIYPTEKFQKIFGIFFQDALFASIRVGNVSIVLKQIVPYQYQK